MSDPSRNGAAHSEDSEPTRQFTGTWATAKLHDLVEQGKITPAAAWLAMVIHAYSKRGKGCYASNSYLGIKVHKQERQVQRLLTSLEEAGILQGMWIGTTRYLKILFDESDQPKKDRKEAYRSENRQTRQKCPVRHVRNDTLDTSEMTYIKNKSKEEEEKPPHPPQAGGKECGLFPSGIAKPPERILAESFFKGLFERDLLEPRWKRSAEATAKSWSPAFKKLLKDYTAEEIETTVKAHVENTKKKKYWPHTADARAFRGKYQKIREAMDRYKPKLGYWPEDEREERRLRLWEKITGNKRDYLYFDEHNRWSNVAGNGPWEILLEDER